MVKSATPATVYEPVPYWAKLPHPMFFKEATSVAVDSNDNVYVFGRGVHPIIIFDRDGNFLETWGADEFVRPHGITIDGEYAVTAVNSPVSSAPAPSSPGRSPDRPS